MTPGPPGSIDPAAEAAAGLLAHRAMLFGLAYRLLGSAQDAEDVLQDAYLRWSTADREAVDEPRRYLSRIVTRLAIDRLRVRQSRRETYIGQWLPEPVPTSSAAGGALGPLDAVEQRESLSIAALHLLERLSPPERAVYVLRTAFEVPYAEIAETLQRSVQDCRQLYHRATRAVAAGRPRFPATDADQRRLLTGLLAAARDGDLSTLTGLLAADATLVSDGGGKVRAALNPIFGAAKVARFLAGVYSKRPERSTVTLVEANGAPGLLIDTGQGRYLLTAQSTPTHLELLHLHANPDKLRPWTATLRGGADAAGAVDLADATGHLRTGPDAAPAAEPSTP